MSSSSSSSRLSRASIIAAIGINVSNLNIAPYSNCRNAKVREGKTRPVYVISPRSTKCSEYIRKNYAKCDVTL
jgi:hypothetical protein